MKEIESIEVSTVIEILIDAMKDKEKTPEELEALASVGNSIANLFNTFI